MRSETPLTARQNRALGVMRRNSTPARSLEGYGISPEILRNFPYLQTGIVQVARTTRVMVDPLAKRWTPARPQSGQR